MIEKKHSVQRLAYLVFEVSDISAWKSFSRTVFGELEFVASDGGDYFGALDDSGCRIILQPGPADDIAAQGWEVANGEVLEALALRLEAAGFTATAGSADQCRRRGVAGIALVSDPCGTTIELCYGVEQNHRYPENKFVCGDRGLGHVVLLAHNLDTMLDFYCNLLDLKVTDYINWSMPMVPGATLNMAFLRANPRHHSLAIGALPDNIPLAKKVDHFMLEAPDQDAVGHSYDRALKSNIALSTDLGLHPNDRSFSYYAVTPSGFRAEFGDGGLSVNGTDWEVKTYDRLSLWGHHPQPAPEEA